MPELTPFWDSLVADDLQRLRDNHLFRHRRVVRPIDATHVECDGKRLTNFSSNNYLGLTHHPDIQQAVKLAVARDGFGSGAAPLISGYGPAHASAERALADWKGCESAVLLPSGYQANVAAVQTLAAIGRLAGGVRFLVDKLAHASIIDAIRATGEPFRVFPHNHCGKLHRLLETAVANELQVVVTESIFSMDGDRADLPEIARLREKFGFLLFLDEAHATGVYGPDGAGLAAELNLRSSVDVSVLTLSKALGGVGGAVCGSQIFCDALVNHGRAYLFSTGIPSAMAAAGEAAIHVLRDEPDRQRRVRTLANYVRQEMKKTVFDVPAGDSPIVPIILGSETLALRAAEELLKADLLVLPVRPPTVPRGGSRLRVTLSSEHSDQEVKRLVRAIAAVSRSGLS